MTQRVDRQPRPPLSQSEYQRIAQAQAEERVRRGFIGFTRPAKREEVMGATQGEARLGTTHRYSQVGRKPSR